MSGTDCLPPVIAHSDHGTIAASAAALPDGLRYWLGFVADAAEYVEQHPEAALTAADLASDYRKDYAPCWVSSPSTRTHPTAISAPRTPIRAVWPRLWRR